MHEILFGQKERLFGGEFYHNLIVLYDTGYLVERAGKFVHFRQFLDGLKTLLTIHNNEAALFPLYDERVQ